MTLAVAGMLNTNAHIHLQFTPGVSKYFYVCLNICIWRTEVNFENLSPKKEKEKQNLRWSSKMKGINEP